MGKRKYRKEVLRRNVKIYENVLVFYSLATFAFIASVTALVNLLWLIQPT